MLRRFLAPAAATGLAASVWQGDRAYAAAEEFTSWISETELRAYHGTLKKLDAISSCTEAVNHPSKNLAWDHSKQKCVPGRMFVPHAPQHLAAELARPFTEDEKENARVLCRLPTVPSTPADSKPKAVFVLGPSGAGKSTLCKTGLKVLFTKPNQPNRPEDYVEIDGDVLRLVHGGYQKAVADPHVGYMDLMKLLGTSRKELKTEFLKAALKNRQNLLIPDTGMDEKKVAKMHAKLVAEGYEIHMIGLVISHKESCDRQLNRAHETGRFPSKGLAYDMWEQALLTVEKYAQPQLTTNAIVFDNTDFHNPFVVYSRTGTLGDVGNAIAEHQKLAHIPT